jgi:hypothetical protein
VQLRPAIATVRTEDVAGETFAVNAHEHFVFAGDITFDEREMVLLIQSRAIEIQIKFAILGWHFHDLEALDEFLARAAIFDEVRHRADFEAMAFGEFQQIWQTGH